MVTKQDREFRRVAGMLAGGLRRLGLHKVEDTRDQRFVTRALPGILTAILASLLAGARNLCDVE